MKLKLLTFLTLTVIVTFNQILISKPVLERGIMPEDWDMLLGYKVEQKRLPFLLERISYIWETQDKLYKNQIIYIGLFNDIFGLNRTAYIITNIVLKILALLSIYLLIVTVSKNRVLAFAASFFFSISPPAAGSLAYIVTGDDYLSLIFMSFFGIYYFNLLIKGKDLYKTILFLTLTILSSPLRMHPFLLVPLLIEIFLVFKRYTKIGLNRKLLPFFMVSLKRLFFLIAPPYLLYLRSVSGDFKVLHTLVAIIGQVTQNNWHTLLPPLFSMGFTITDNSALITIATISGFTGPANENKFLLGIILSLALVTFLATAFITWLIKPKYSITFFTTLYLSANILNVLIYLSIQNINNIPVSIRAPFNSTNFFTPFIGGYYLVLGIAILLEWFIHQKQNKFLLMIPASILWTAVFASFTWLEVGSGISYGNPVHRYLTVPSLGTSFFVATLLVIFIKRLESFRFAYLKYSFIFLAALIFIPIYLHQINSVNSYYNEDNKLRGRSGVRQEILKNRFNLAIGKIDPAKPTLIYIELGKNKEILPDYENTFFNIIMHSAFYDPDNSVIYSCQAFIYPTYSELLKISSIKDSKIAFNQDSRCTGKEGRYGRKITYTSENFYAFLLEDDHFFNIKQQVLDKLRSDLYQGVLNIK